TPATKNTEAHNAYLQGHFHFQRRNLEDSRKAVGYFDEAIGLDPDYALAYAERCEALTLIGDLSEDKSAWSKARSDAENAVANATARKAAELQPGAAFSHRLQVLIAVQRGDGETALREAQLEPDEGYRRFELALAHYARGDRQAADTALADLIANGRDQLAYQIAQVYAVRGETDKAFEWLQIAFDNHDTGTLGLSIDPVLRGLRGDPRYKSMLEKVSLPTSL